MPAGLPGRGGHGRCIASRRGGRPARSGPRAGCRTRRPAAGISEAIANTGTYETRSTSTPVSSGNSMPLRPEATPVRPVTRATAELGKVSDTAANMLAESAVCPSRTRQMATRATGTVLTRTTARLRKHSVAPAPIVMMRAWRTVIAAADQVPGEPAAADAPNVAEEKRDPREEGDVGQREAPNPVEILGQPVDVELHDGTDQQPAQHEAPRLWQTEQDPCSPAPVRPSAARLRGCRPPRPASAPGGPRGPGSSGATRAPRPCRAGWARGRRPSSRSSA